MKPCDQDVFAIVKLEYERWLNNKIAIEETPTQAAKIMKILKCINS